MRSATSYLVVLFVLDLCTEIHDETVQVPSTSTCPFAFVRSSHFQSWSGVSNRIIVKACNVSAKLGQVPTCGNNVQFVVEQPETVNRKTIRSVEQVMMDAQGRNCLKILYLCAVFLLKGDAPAIELISIAKKMNTARLHGYFS